MTFSSLPFLLGFLPMMLTGCLISSRLGPSWFKAWLIAVSILFAAISDPLSLRLLLGSVAGNYLLLRLMARSDRPAPLAAAGVALNLALLGWFKFAGAAQPLPLGISFFTFTQIGCLVLHAEPGARPPAPSDYALFAMFFPALIAGPVLNAREMLRQYAARTGWRLTPDDLAVGFGFLIIGLLKKTLIADPLAPIVAAGFANPAALSLPGAWQAACAWSLQLYFDFSGYTDMAIGLAWMVGLRFPDNFDQPYRARCISDYWQRWHMSLTRFLMAHVHTPLTLTILRRRRRAGLPVDVGAQRTAAGFASMIAAPVLLTMMLVALWHGDTATFLLFGLLNVFYLLVNHAWRLYRLPPIPRLPSIALTYLCVLIAGVVFRAPSIAGAMFVLGGMAGRHGFGALPTGRHDIAQALFVAVVYALVWFAPPTRQIMLSGRAFAWRESTGWAVTMGAAAVLGVLAAGGTGEFVYGHF